MSPPWTAHNPRLAPATCPPPCCRDALAYDAATCGQSCAASSFAIATAEALAEAVLTCGCDAPALAIAQVRVQGAARVVLSGGGGSRGQQSLHGC